MDGKGLIWPPLEPKTESYVSPISSDWFIRRMTPVSRGARDSKIGKKWPESSRILDFILS